MGALNIEEQFDLAMIYPFITAAKSAFEIQAAIGVESGQPFLKQDSDSTSVDLAGVLSFSSEKYTGIVTLCFGSEVFLKLYEKITGEKHQEINDEIEDAAGELLNIIYGQARIELNQLDNGIFGKAIPTVLAGSGLKVRHQTSQPTVVLPFQSDVGPVCIELSIQAEEN